MDRNQAGVEKRNEICSCLLYGEKKREPPRHRHARSSPPCATHEMRKRGLVDYREKRGADRDMRAPVAALCTAVKLRAAPLLSRGMSAPAFLGPVAARPRDASPPAPACLSAAAAGRLRPAAALASMKPLLNSGWDLRGSGVGVGETAGHQYEAPANLRPASERRAGEERE